MLFPLSTAFGQESNMAFVLESNRSVNKIQNVKKYIGCINEKIKGIHGSNMKNLHKHGKAPYGIAVIHGGPGAGGEMSPVARMLCSKWGILEPIQTSASLKGQLEELKSVLEVNGALPVILIGFSWGAWLSFLLAAEYPFLVRKLILVGSGPFEEKYAAKINQIRLQRLSKKERKEIETLTEILNKACFTKNKAAFAGFGALFSKADAYDPIKDIPEVGTFNVDIFQSVWREAKELRRSGKLLSAGKHIKCPVVAIHGDYDPHPAEGVKKPLNAILKNFRFILLKNCGHKPWIERGAREEFFRILKDELI